MPASATILYITLTNLAAIVVKTSVSLDNNYLTVKTMPQQ
jgi:hypothetical protein